MIKLPQLARTLIAFGAAFTLMSSCKEKTATQESADKAQAVASQSAAAPTAMPRRVLLVESYHAEYPWVAAIDQGVGERLRQANIPFEVFYMDTKRKTDDAWKREAGALATKKFDEYRPGIIIAADDNAQQFFGKNYVDGKVPLVFCGVNHDPSRYGYPARNVTGIIERPNLKQTLQLMQRIKPIKTFALISDDDPTSVGTLNYLKQVKVDEKLVEARNIETFADWQKAIREFNGKVDAVGIFNYHTLKKSGATTSMDPVEVMTWTIENLSIPSMGFQDFTMQDGALLGVAESGVEQGHRAAEYAIKILDGTPPASLPVVPNEMGSMMLNKSTADRLKLKIDPAALKDVKVVTKELAKKL